MLQTKIHALAPVALAALLLAACAQRGPVVQPDVRQPPTPQSQEPEQPAAVEPPPVPRIDTMADVQGDKPLPPLAGALERIDCMTGEEDQHARMAFEARGGRVANFAYYSKWKPRTCAFDFSRTSPSTKWRLTPDGATRVHTPQGRFLIRTLPDAYVFEFEQVQRGKFCGMPGDFNGVMIVKRKSVRPECTVAGIMDINDPYLEHLR